MTPQDKAELGRLYDEHKDDLIRQATHMEIITNVTDDWNGSEPVHQRRR